MNLPIKRCCDAAKASSEEIIDAAIHQVYFLLSMNP